NPLGVHRGRRPICSGSSTLAANTAPLKPLARLECARCGGMCKYLTLACKRVRRIAYPRVETQARGELEDGLGGTNRNKVPIRSYPTRGYNSAPAWLAVSTDAFEPWARSSRSMRH